MVYQKKNNFLLVMAGGIGSRFWPFSRSKKPKQFLDILGTGRTLIQQTVDRFKEVIPLENVYVVTNSDYKDLVMEQLDFLNEDQILLEPIGRNTAPCIAYGINKISIKNEDANVVVTPSDHVILNEKAFHETIYKGIKYVSEHDSLLTLGIHPSRPDTGYGYIQFLEDENDIKKVKTFTEKPNLELAETFLESGDFLWNSGMFIWNLRTIQIALDQHVPDISEIFVNGKAYYFTDQENAYIQEAYSQCKNISIDYGVMEKSSNVYVLPSEFGWTDLGTWKSLFETKSKDDENNVVVGNVILSDTKNSMIQSDSKTLMVIDGLDDYIVVQHEGVVLICRKGDEQKVKHFVTDIKQSKNLNKFS